MKALLLSALTLCLLTSCGGGDPKDLTDQGAKALNSGSYEAAAKSFEQALAAMGSDTSSPEWLRAKLGMIQAHVHTDAAKAQTEFLELAAANPSKVTDDHFSLIGSRLGDADHLMEATAVLTAGMKAHPKSPALEALLKDIGKRAESSGDSEAVKALEGLGYTGSK